MSKNIKPYSRFVGGISDFDKESLIVDAFAFGRSVDIRTDPQNITILPRTIKESGSVVIDLPKWADTIPGSLTTYFYGSSGNIYRRTSARSWSLLRSVASSHGNGLAYFAEDDFIYYTSDKLIGRYGPISGTPTFVDDFFGSQGGVPLNTHSLDLESSSSQYADRADTASLSITGNLSVRAQIKPESLPSVGNTSTLVAKWTENGNARSYKFDIAAVSGYFGDGSDGALTISSNTTEAPIDSTCSGTSGASTLTATNASFTANQVVLIHQTRGTGAGTWQRNTISSYVAGTITLVNALNATYTDSGSSQAQVRVLKQYTDVTIDASRTYTTKAWDENVGGILGFLASGTLTVNGTISANGANGQNGGVGGIDGGGFHGGTYPYTGEGTAGTFVVSQNSANGNGGGEAGDWAAGGGGGNGTAGSDGGAAPGTNQNGIPWTTYRGIGGDAVGTTDLTTMIMGGGGGGGSYFTGGVHRTGGNGGGIIFISAATITINNSTGSITANGGNGMDGSGNQGSASGGGAGGSILLKAQTATLNTNRVTATGGTGGSNSTYSGGNGGSGRIHLDYYTSYTGTTSPTLDVTQDNTLVTNTTYQLRLAVSSNGTNSETLAQEASLLTGVWQQVGVAWTASSSSATFYLNGVAIGTRTGTFTSISDNASRFGIGKYIDSGGSAAGFYDGLIDEVQVFNNVQSSSDFVNALSSQILTTTAGLKAYYKLNNDYTDSTANGNDLTSSGSPVFSTDVPFPSPTTRLDIDQSSTTAGNTYTTPTSISESSTNRKTFTPAKDPQKSLSVLVAAIGTGDWTVTVHDQYNNVMASSTIVNASMSTGYQEFTFSTPWRPLTNFTNNYHFHITSTVNDGTVTTTNASDLETVSYRTYYQFLVNDTDYHPVNRMLQFLVLGNERWIAKIEAGTYYPNLIALPAGYRIRCWGYWNEYIVAGTWRGDAITDFDSGRLYFWDGIAPTYNFFVDVPEGGINALFGTPGRLFIWAGYQGDLLVYEGGISARKIKRLPKITPSTYVEVAPGAVTMWQALLRYGVALNSDSTTIQKGVYTHGSNNVRYPEILTYDHVISTGNYTGTSLKVGLVYPIGQDLIIGYQDNVSYGVDYVNNSNAVYPSATVEFLIEDDETIWKEKEANTLVANFAALSSGQSISLKRKINGETNWTANYDSSTAGDTVSRMVIPNGRYNQVQVAIDLATTISTGPTIYGVSLERDLLENSGRVG